MDLPELIEHVEYTTQFRLLDLPAELRLMIYEFRPFSITTCHCSFSWWLQQKFLLYRSVAINLVINSIPTSLLSTCKLVNAEAAPIFAPKLEYLHAEPFRLIVDSPAFLTLFDKYEGRFFVPYHPGSSYQHGPSFDSEVSKHLSKSYGHDHAVSRESKDMHSALLNAVQSNDCEGANAFFHTCAEYLTKRKPSETCVAITRHPHADLKDIIRGLNRTILDISCWFALPEPVGFMIRAAITDEFDDPRSPNYPEGAKRGALHSTMTRRLKLSYSRGIKPLYVEDVGDAEWEEVWGKTTK